MVISKSGIHCFFELRIICLPPPSLYSQHSIHTGCALVCLNLLVGALFLLDVFAFPFNRMLFPNTLFYQRNAFKKSFQSHPGLVFKVTEMYLVIEIVDS